MNAACNSSIYLSKTEGGHRWGSLTFGGFLLICFLTAGYNIQSAYQGYRKNVNGSTWLSEEKAMQLMRYHGTNGIKITADKAYIKRDGHWICVYRDPSILPEAVTPPSPPIAKGDACANNS